MADHTPAILALSRTVLPTHDGRVPAPGATAAPTGAHAVLYGGTATPSGRLLTGKAGTADHAWQIVAVSNAPAGCRTVAGLLTATLDAQPIAGSLLTVEHVSDPIEDRDDPTEWRWTATLDLRLSAPT